MRNDLAIQTLESILENIRNVFKKKLQEYEELARVTGNYQSGWTIGLSSTEREIQALELAIDTLKLQSIS
jgi:uncharacterized coiled-coil DUF342 family protein